ncbi:MAG: hypothetical protein Q4E26_02095 [Prevotellaceae bacterium]|nr:hypothetical protein [Bacteroidaceae bacterium]MDO4959175.1 hypothetical protein [Prevotellaceae bacterium]MDO4991729.1 hypothetical protein [Prevotellaceae bacterium]
MKKILFIAVLCLTAVLSASAQSVEFTLTADGTFHMKDGRNYAIVPFEGKSAHAIYSALFVNAGEVYKDPKQKVIITIDGSSVGIRAFDPKLTYKEENVYLGGYYELNFEVKDGKVKVAAPVVDEILTRQKDGVRDKDFTKLVRSWYQETSLQAKYQDNKFYTEQEFNSFINGVLTGNFMGDSSDNW